MLIACLERAAAHLFTFLRQGVAQASHTATIAPLRGSRGLFKRLARLIEGRRALRGRVAWGWRAQLGEH